MASAAALVAALASVWVFRGALGYGFSQDDFLGLARTVELAPRLPFGWRWLSHQAWWDLVAGPLAGQARAAHLVSLVLMAAIGATTTLALACRLSVPPALVGGTFVATHPAAFTAVYWAAANGDLVATLAALAAFACLASSRARAGAPFVFALALLAKESVVAFPLAWLVARCAWPQGLSHAPLPWRDHVWWACVGVSAVTVAGLAWGGRTGVGGEAYALSLGALGGNLLTYAGWAANRWLATVTGFGDAVDPAVFGWGGALLVLGAAGAALPAWRRAGMPAAAATLLVLLAPVLPLANHTYHYYLVAALPALGWWVAALVEPAFARIPRAVATALALGVAIACTLDGAELVRKVETMPFRYPELRADPTVDRARIAANALGDLQAAALPAGTVLRLWSPQAQGMAEREGAATGTEGYYERNVRAALLDGLAIRVRVPTVDSVAFVRTFAPVRPDERWAVYRYDGHLRVLSAGELAQVIASAPLR